LNRELAALRLKLAAWYTALFGAILLAAGMAAYLFVARQIAGSEDRSLHTSVRSVIDAAQIRKRESALGRPEVADAFAELSMPGRTIYVFDENLALLAPAEAPDWVRAAAAEALRSGEVHATHEDTGVGPEIRDRSWRLYAKSFSLSGDPGRLVGVAVADMIDLDDRYSALITAFSIGAFLSILAAAAGGYWLSGRAAAPAGAAFEQMRRFAADAAHELRGSVAAIRTRAEVAGEADEPGARRHALEEIARDAAHLGDVLEKLLFLARSDYGRLVLQPETVHLDDVMLECAPGAEALARPRAIEVELQATGDCAVAGDAALLRQLLMILLDNAIKFTPAGGRVGVRTAGEGDLVLLEVWDSGPGFPDETGDRVFEPFYRADPSPDEAGGAGLGLAIARRIVEAHGGEISIESSAAGGALVRVKLKSRPGAGGTDL
jgi:signal transduction histidine kinase